MSVHDAQPGDIYLDARGCLWKVVGTWHEPVIDMVQIDDPRVPMLENSMRPHQLGGVSGLMWQGFKRIHRLEDLKMGR
jgi:hypothetical protein